MVASPTSVDGVTSELRDLTENTFFTSTTTITLDSIYFGRGSRVACTARAVNNDGESGLESASEPVEISTEKSICQSRNPGSVGAEPFASDIRYVGSGEHSNSVKISVSMPHVDGMLPVISTSALGNFESTLSKDVMRIANHR